MSKTYTIHVTPQNKNSGKFSLQEEIVYDILDYKIDTLEIVDYGYNPNDHGISLEGEELLRTICRAMINRPLRAEDGSIYFLADRP